MRLCFITHCYIFIAFICQAGSNMEYFAAAKAAAYKVFEIIDRVPDIDCMSEEGHKPTKVRGEITFKNIDFTYPSREDVQVNAIIIFYLYIFFCIF